MWKLSFDITMNIQKSFRKKALFSCSMACLVDLCFDLEFSFRLKNCGKQIHTASIMLKVRTCFMSGEPRALQLPCWRYVLEGAARERETEGWFQDVFFQPWRSCCYHGFCWNAWGWAVPAALHTLPWGAIPLCVPRMNCSESVLICTCTISLEWLEITKGCSVLGACPGKGGSGQPCCSGHTVL